MHNPARDAQVAPRPAREYDRQPARCGDFRSATVDAAHARSRRHDPRTAVPAGPRVGQREDAADGQAARPAGADRVLRLLPAQLAAHPPLRPRVARALRRRGACASCRCTARGFPPGDDADTVRAAVARLGIEHPVVPRPRLRAVATPTTTRAGPRATCSTATRSCSSTTRRGRLRRDRTGDPGAAGRRRRARRRRCIPRTCPTRRSSPQTPDQPGAYSGPYAAGAVWVVVEGAGTIAVNGAPVAVEVPERGCASSSIPTTPRPSSSSSPAPA